MSRNSSTFSRDYKNAKANRSVPRPRDIDYNSKMGYSDGSPFSNRPFMDINTPTGYIDMSNTGMPLFANGYYLPPYSGQHFMGTDKVREIPAAMYGGDPSLPGITGHYPFGGQHTKTHTHFKTGGWLNSLPKAQGTQPTSIVKVQPLDKKFIYNKKDLENLILQERAAGCHHGECLGGANTYFNTYVAPQFGMPDSWKINEKYGIMSGNPDMPYGVSADSWDLAAELQKKGAIQNYAAPLYDQNKVRNYGREAEIAWKNLSPEEKKKLYSTMALGTLVNFGDYGPDESRRSGSNEKAGLYPSRHSARVSGFTEEGVPVLYDYGHIVTMDDPYFTGIDFPVTNITTPKEYSKYNYDYIKKWQEANQGYEYNPNEKLYLFGQNIRKDESSSTPEETQFISGINDNIKKLMEITGRPQEDIIKAGKIAFGIMEGETRGGRGWAKAKGKELAKNIFDPFSILSSEPSRGLTRMKKETLAGDETNRYSRYVKELGLDPEKMDLWDPNTAALATTALILSRKGSIEGIDDWYLRAQQHNQPAFGKEKLEYLKAGDADYANNIINNSNRIYSPKTGYGIKETNEWLKNKQAALRKKKIEQAAKNVEKEEKNFYIKPLITSESTQYVNPRVEQFLKKSNMKKYGGPVGWLDNLPKGQKGLNNKFTENPDNLPYDPDPRFKIIKPEDKKANEVEFDLNPFTGEYRQKEYVELPEMTISAKKPETADIRKEFEKENPMDYYMRKKKEAYIKNTPMASSTLSSEPGGSFPSKVASNFTDNYGYDRDTYIIEQLAKRKGIDLNNRTDLMYKLAPNELEILKNSKYGYLYQPSAWSKGLAGLANMAGLEPTYSVPGLTDDETRNIANEEILGVPTGWTNTFAPIDIFGQAIANAAKNRNPSTGGDFRQLPGVFSGRSMANVTPLDAAASNPLNYLDLAKALPSLAEGVVNIPRLANTIGQGTRKLANKTGLSISDKIGRYTEELNNLQRLMEEVREGRQALKERYPDFNVQEYTEDVVRQLGEQELPQAALTSQMRENLRNMNLTQEANIPRSRNRIRRAEDVTNNAPLGSDLPAAPPDTDPLGLGPVRSRFNNTGDAINYFRNRYPTEPHLIDEDLRALGWDPDLMHAQYNVHGANPPDLDFYNSLYHALKGNDNLVDDAFNRFRPSQQSVTRAPDPFAWPTSSGTFSNLDEATEYFNKTYAGNTDQIRNDLLSQGYDPDAVMDVFNNIESIAPSQRRQFYDNLYNAISGNEYDVTTSFRNRYESKPINIIDNFAKDKKAAESAKNLISKDKQATGHVSYHNVQDPIIHNVNDFHEVFIPTNKIDDYIKDLEKVKEEINSGAKSIKGGVKETLLKIDTQLEDLKSTKWLRGERVNELKAEGLLPDENLSIMTINGSKNLVNANGQILGTVNLWGSNKIGSTGLNLKFHGYGFGKKGNKSMQEALDHLTTRNMQELQNVYRGVDKPQMDIFNEARQMAMDKINQLNYNNNNKLGRDMYRAIHHGIKDTKGPLYTERVFAETELPDQITGDLIKLKRAEAGWNAWIRDNFAKVTPSGSYEIVKEYGGDIDWDMPYYNPKALNAYTAFSLGDYKQGGTPKKLSKKSSSKNIKSSINKIMARNTTLYGDSGKAYYEPNVKPYYKSGGWLDEN